MVLILACTGLVSIISKAETITIGEPLRFLSGDLQYSEFDYNENEVARFKLLNPSVAPFDSLIVTDIVPENLTGIDIGLEFSYQLNSKTYNFKLYFANLNFSYLYDGTTMTMPLDNIQQSARIYGLIGENMEYMLDSIVIGEFVYNTSGVIVDNTTSFKLLAGNQYGYLGDYHFGYISDNDNVNVFDGYTLGISNTSYSYGLENYVLWEFGYNIGGYLSNVATLVNNYFVDFTTIIQEQLDLENLRTATTLLEQLAEGLTDLGNGLYSLPSTISTAVFDFLISNLDTISVNIADEIGVYLTDVVPAFSELSQTAQDELTQFIADNTQSMNNLIMQIGTTTETATTTILEFANDMLVVVADGGLTATETLTSTTELLVADLLQSLGVISENAVVTITDLAETTIIEVTDTTDLAIIEVTDTTDLAIIEVTDTANLAIEEFGTTGNEFIVGLGATFGSAVNSFLVPLLPYLLAVVVIIGLYVITTRKKK